MFPTKPKEKKLLMGWVRFCDSDCLVKPAVELIIEVTDYLSQGDRAQLDSFYDNIRQQASIFAGPFL